MASSPLPNLRGKREKHRSRGFVSNPRGGDDTPPIFELDEVTQNLSPLVSHHPSPNPTQPPSALRQRWSPFLRSPFGSTSPFLRSPFGSTSPFLRSPFGSTSPSLFQSYIPSCTSPKLPRPSLLSRIRRRHRRVTGTLFGQRKGRVTFAVQVEPEDRPSLLLELSFPTNFLIDAMAAGAVTILLECDKSHVGARDGARIKMAALWEEPVWTMYSNGLQCGLALSRPFNDDDHRVFHTIGAISTGAGVLPPCSSATSQGYDPASDVMFMRTSFERVVRNSNSEAFYMRNPGGARRGRSDLSIFLLRI